MQNSEPSSLPRGLFTSCPSCMQQFRIQASQLSIASGQVECGTCGHQFSALSRLSDIPLTIDEKSYEYDYEPEPEAEVKTEIEQEFYIPVSEEEAFSPEMEINEDVESFPEELSDSVLQDLAENLPDELREDIPPKRSLFASVCWGLGALLLLIIIIVQLAWFNRDGLLLRYPEIEPIARGVCEKLHCELLRYKDVGAIKLINRDVRNHPLYEDSLLVNATMANKSETIQPFPLIQLALFNTGGEVIGYREFKPKEYLDDSINIPAGMTPESLVYFVLEVSGPTKDAVSFEFHFL